MSQKIRCVIVDDEPLARDIIEQFIAVCPTLELVGNFTNAVEVRDVLKSSNVDLLFLDINLPELTGIDFMKSLVKPPLVVFTTAYSQYALEGFEVDAVDYLLKPISFDRFKRALSKVEEKMSLNASVATPPEFIMLKSNRKFYKVDFKSILYFESVGDYVKVCTSQQSIIVHDTLKNIQALLCGTSFIRVHKSFIIAVDRISYVEGNLVKVGEALIPVSLSYKEELLQRLK